MSIIVRTLDSKMLQDTVAGVILNAHRPTLTENTSFIETRAVKNEYRPAEVEVLVSDFQANEKVTDKTLGEDWQEYVRGLKKNEDPDVEKFVQKWASDNGRVKKGVDKTTQAERDAAAAEQAAAKKKANA